MKIVFLFLVEMAHLIGTAGDKGVDEIEREREWKSLEERCMTHNTDRVLQTGRGEEKERSGFITCLAKKVKIEVENWDCMNETREMKV